MQQTDFPFEICIGEDDSDDGTREVCREYAEKHPDIIILHLRDRNNPMRKQFVAPFMFNMLGTLAACRGKYIALLEGDDYWTDTQKLQKQVDVMELDPECMLCFHSAKELRIGESRVIEPSPLRSVYTPYDFFRMNIAITCTVMYRNLFKGEFPSWIFEAPLGDWSQHLCHLQSGHARFIDEPMACYRIHAGGVWSSSDGPKKRRDMICMGRAFLKHFPKSLHRNVPKELICECRSYIVRYHLVWGNFPFKGRRDLLKLLFAGHLPVHSLSEFLRLLLWTFLPWVGLLFRNRRSGSPRRSEEQQGCK